MSKNQQTKKAVPDPIIKSCESAVPISYAIKPQIDFRAREYPWASRFIGQHPIPDFQRELCWTLDQEVKFIESVFYGYDLGSYMINDWDYVNDLVPADELILKKNSSILLDGQQRINALIRYRCDEFRVFGFLFSELEKKHQSRFLNTTFTCRRVSTFDRELLVTVYNHLNFSGVRHTDNQKAQA